MKIYNKVTINIFTGEILYEDSYEYSGDIIHCKGGSTTTVQGQIDYAYNARMATIAEQQQSIANQLYANWEQNYKPEELAQVAANMQLIPAQTNLELAAISAQRSIIPYETQATQTQYAAATKIAEAQTSLIPQQTKTTSTLLQEQQKEAEAKMGLLPQETATTLAQSKTAQALAESQGRLIPGQEAAQTEILGLTKESAAAGRELIPGLMSSTNINIGDRVAQARSDVSQQFGIARKELASTATPYRMGAGIQDLAAEEAKARVQAQTSAKRLGEQEQYQRQIDTAKVLGGVV